MSDPQLASLLAYIFDEPIRPRDANPSELVWLGEATDAQLEEFLRHLLAAELSRRNDPALSEAFRYLVYRLRPWDSATRRRLQPTTIPLISELYRRLGSESTARGPLLQLLSSSAIPYELEEFANLVVTDPPGDAPSAMLAFGPLFQHTAYDTHKLFPRLLDAIAHETIAASVIDLANFLFRRGLISPHPGEPRKQQLTELLGAIVQRLSRLEEGPDESMSSLDELAQQVDEGVALAVALCDALALIGDRDAIGKLYQALEVRHRRLHTEAAAALTRLGEEAGQHALVALAAEPVARLRVLAFADELGLTEKIDEQYTTPVAQAEAELTLWLAQPGQMGVAPTQLELVDSRTLHWPGYEEPMECFLFRFIYQFSGGTFGNVGIAGPLTHAFSVDLQDLPPDDIYAAFAGWHAQHDEIFELDASTLNERQRLEVAKLERRLRERGFDAIQPVVLGMFLSDCYLVARATREGQAGIAVGDEREPSWFPTRNSARPLGVREACCIHKGRRLLRSFN